MKRISPIRTRRTDAPALLELKTSLRDTQNALSHAYAAFDYTSDPELTQACMFDNRSLQSSINCQVRKIKELDHCAAAAARTAGRARWT